MSATIRTEQLTKRYGKYRGITDVDLEVTNFDPIPDQVDDLARQLLMGVVLMVALVINGVLAKRGGT